MYSFQLLFVVILFGVSMFSDVVLNYMSIHKNANPTLKSLRPYYNKYGDILAAILAGITVVTVYIIHLLIFNIYLLIFGETSYSIIVFFISGIVLGILADIIVDNLHIFGNSLVTYYKLPFSYGWGFVAYLFAIIVSYGIEKAVGLVK
jgi:hypothetical protein